MPVLGMCFICLTPRILTTVGIRKQTDSNKPESSILVKIKGNQWQGNNMQRTKTTKKALWKQDNNPKIYDNA